MKFVKEGKTFMNNHITLKQVKERLEEANLEFEALDLGGGFSIICTARGGRILGPFENENGESFTWLNPAFKSEEKFAEFLKNEDWNMGGDRMWCLPEMPFFVEKRNDFFNRYVVQKELDPGNYALDSDGKCVSMGQTVKLGTFEAGGAVKEFTLGREIRSAANPLNNSDKAEELMHGVKYCGILQRVKMNVLDSDETLYLEPWLLTQINPSGELIVPTVSKAEYIDYYEPVPQDYTDIKENLTRLKVTGDLRYKVGFKASQLTGRSGYIGMLSDGRAYLFFRNYFNNPSAVYCGDPYASPGLYGCSLYLYNGHTAQGGFSEFEHCSSTVSGDTGIRKSDEMSGYYFYIGSKSAVEKIAEELI